MKGLIWLPFTLILGMALGSWPARHQRSRNEREIMELRQQLRQRQRQPGTLTQLAQFMRPPEQSPLLEPARSATTNGTAAPTSTEAGRSSSTNRIRRRVPLAELRGRPGDERTLRERLDEAIEAWRIRSEVARNNFVTRAGLTPDQAAQFDVLIQAMNLRMREHFDQFVATVQAGEPITPEAGARMIRALSDAVVLTYDEMDHKLPGWRQSAPGLDLGDLIDPSVAEPLLSIETRLRETDRGDRN